MGVGLINGGVCIKKKSPLVGWDDCAEWARRLACARAPF